MLAEITKKDIDVCAITPEWAGVCDDIRSVFFLSRSMRKERDAWFYFTRSRVLVTFNGSTLRYLGPDERSTLMLFEKALATVAGARHSPQHEPDEPRWIESTPGVRSAGELSRDIALGLFSKAHEKCTCYLPEFQAPMSADPSVLALPRTLHGFLSTGTVGIVLFSPSGNAAEADATGNATTARSPSLIKAPVIVKTSLVTHASKIMIFNLIEDNARVDGT